MDEDDIKIIVRSGMSAAFSAIFGTPLAAVVFALEVGNVGNMHYAALVPCMLASLVASSISTMLGAHAEAFTITEPVSFSLVPALKIAFLGICCALISVLFCYLLHKVGHLLKEYFKNAYVRILVGSVLVIGLTVILQTTAYSGAGVNLIEEAFAGTSPKTAFIWKMIFTAITLGAGFKGGEIVPSFTIGATFGCLFGIALGLSPSLCAAVAMVSVFCGVTNCPIASLLIGFELFGFGAMKYLLIGISITYLLSGYGGLYSEQTIVFSKLEEKIINKKAQ
jgi:H+/Cl- antiporter ClcA